MALLTGRLVVLVLVAGLTAKIPPWPLWPQVGVALAAPVTADLGTAPAPEPAGRGVNLLAPLAEGEGRAFSEKPDGTVKATLGGKRSAPKGGGKPFTLNDGEVVKFVDDNGGIDMGADTFAQVVARKKKVSVPNGQIILENRLHRSGDGIYARKGNAKESVVYLRMLTLMGKPQRARLQQASKDDAFKAIADSDEFRAVFK